MNFALVSRFRPGSRQGRKRPRSGWARPIGVIAPTENCQTLTPGQATRLVAQLISRANDSRKLFHARRPSAR